MTVANGQPANQTTFNNGLVSKTNVAGTNVVTGIIALNNTTDPNSGNPIVNTQRLQNELADADGVVGEGDATSKMYSSNNVVTDGDNRKVAIGKLDATFDSTTGHNHDGSAGNGGPVSASDLADLNYFRAAWQTFTVTGAVGINDDVSTQLSGKTPGGNATTEGVITTAPYNKVELRDSSTETFLEDAGGQRIYGRITESVGVWTLTYYTNEAGVETSTSLASTNIRVYFREVFTLETIPTIPDDAGFIGSLDLSADIVASGSDTNVQYNKNGRFFGNGNFFFRDSTTSLGLGPGVDPSGMNSFAVGDTSTASGDNSVAMGLSTNATGSASHAEGNQTTAGGNYSHAEGDSSNASGIVAHAEGNNTHSDGMGSHSEGNQTWATGDAAHSEGGSSNPGTLGLASGENSHVEGLDCIASGDNSHAAGEGTLAQADNQTAVGQYNVGVGTPGAPASTDEIFTVGYGANSGSRATAFNVLRSGIANANKGIKIYEELNFPRTDVASAGTPFNALTYKPFTKLTGTTAATINGISSGADAKATLIHNGTDQDLVFSHESASASASDRLNLPDSNDITISPAQSLEFIYDSGQSRWVLKSGTGTGTVIPSGITLLSDYIFTNGSNVTATPAAPGEYRTLIKDNAATTLSDNAPSQTLASILADGFRIFSTNGTGAGNSGDPNAWHIFVGTGKSVKFVFYKDAGRADEVNPDYFQDSGGDEYGLFTEYDETLGIASVVLPIKTSAGNRSVGSSISETGGTTDETDLYFDVFVADNDFQIDITTAPLISKSNSSGTFTTTSGTPVAVTNLSVTVNLIANESFDLYLQSDNLGTASKVHVNSVSNAYCKGYMTFSRNSTEIARYEISVATSTTASQIDVPSSSFRFTDDTPDVGSNTYTVEVFTTDSITVESAILVVRSLKT